MSLKAELESWAAALKAYDEEDFDKSLQLFGQIADSSKILTNIGLIYATLGEHEAAIENFNAATSLDQFLAVAYFQCGVSNFLLTRYELALKDFEEALLYLRGNQAINYEQLGLKFKLYSAEVLFNKGLCQIYMGQVNEGLQDLGEASQEKSTPEHSVIDDAIQDRGEGYTVFSIPVGVLYRPSENKIKNSATKDYLGKAKLVAATDSREAYTTFTGVTRLQQGMTPTGAPLDRPDAGPSPILARSNTSLAALPKPTPEPGSGLQRNATTINVVSREERQERLQAAAAGGLTRGLSLRTAGGPGGAVRAARSPDDDSQDNSRQSPGKDVSADKQSRITEIYDNYINDYNEEIPDVPPLPSLDPKQRVAAWAKNNANPAVRRGASSGSNYAPSSYGGGSMRRKSTRRTNYGSRSMASGARSTVYEEEEEGYVSGDYDDGPPELVKILVKLHYKDDIRGMAIQPDMPFDEFLERVTNKFGTAINGLGMKFKDEEGTRVSLRDDSDFDLAIETAKENARGKAEGKLEVWCVDQ